MKSDTEMRRLEDLQNGPKCVLFVEDNIDDYILTCWQLSQAGFRNKVMHVSSADELLEYLRGMDQYLDRDRYPMPAVIVMDMHLPGASGLEAQAMLRTNLQVRHVPIIAISTSDNLPKLKAAVECGAQAWMTKPFDAATFAKIALELELPLKFETPSGAQIQSTI